MFTVRHEQDTRTSIETTEVCFISSCDLRSCWRDWKSWITGNRMEINFSRYIFEN